MEAADGASFNAFHSGSAHDAVGIAHREGNTALHSSHCTGSPEKKSLAEVRDVAVVAPV